MGQGTGVGQPQEGVRIGGFQGGDRAMVYLLFGVPGAGLGALLPYVAGWVSELPWAPFQGPLELLASFDAPWLVWGRPVLGLIVGLLFAAWVVQRSPVLHLTGEEIRVERGGDVERVIPGTKVDAVYRRGAKVVIETDTGRELFHDEVEGDKAAVRDAFVSQGYPWEGPRD